MYELSDTSIMLKQCHSESETFSNHLNYRLDLTKYKKMNNRWKTKREDCKIKEISYIYAHCITDLWPALLPKDNERR